MLTSSRNWSSGSARQALSATGGADAPTPPAQSASSRAALRSHLPRPSTKRSPEPALALAQHRLRFGDHVVAVVERLDILDRDGSSELALVGRVDRNVDVAAVDLGIDRDCLQQRDRVLDARLEYPDLAKGRARTGPAKLQRNNAILPNLGTRRAVRRDRAGGRFDLTISKWPRLFLEMDVGDPGSGLEIAEPYDDGNGHAVDRRQLEAHALFGLAR